MSQRAMRFTEQLLLFALCVSLAYARPQNRVVSEGRPAGEPTDQTERDRGIGGIDSLDENPSENVIPNDPITVSTTRVIDFELSTPRDPALPAVSEQSSVAADQQDSGTTATEPPSDPSDPVTEVPRLTTTIINLEREQPSSTVADVEWKSVDNPATPFVPTFNPPVAAGAVCKLGQTPAWQFVKCKAKAFARRAKQAQGDASKWIMEKSECLAKISKGAGHAIEQVRRCLASIQLRSRDIDEQLKGCFTGGDNRPENREWNEGIVCFTGLNGKTVGVLQQVARVVVLYIVQVGYRALLVYFSNGVTEKIFF